MSDNGCSIGLLIIGFVLINFAFWGFIAWLVVNFIIPAIGKIL